MPRSLDMMRSGLLDGVQTGRAARSYRTSRARGVTPDHTRIVRAVVTLSATARNHGNPGGVELNERTRGGTRTDRWDCSKGVAGFRSGAQTGIDQAGGS